MDGEIHLAGANVATPAITLSCAPTAIRPASLRRCRSPCSLRQLLATRASVVAATKLYCCSASPGALRRHSLTANSRYLN